MVDLRPPAVPTLPPLPPTPAEYIWGTVTSAAPLAVRLDGDAGATPAWEDLSGPREIGARVYCQMANRRLTILGPASKAAQAATLRLTSTADASLTSTEHALQIGSTSGANMRIDQNEVMSVNNGAASPLYINGDGGIVMVGSSLSEDAYIETMNSVSNPGRAVPNRAYVDQIHRATELGANTNLNNVVEPGAYIQSQNAEASTSLNYPEATAGLLEVYGFGNTTGMRWQRYSVYNSVGDTRTVYQRSYYSTAGWSSWATLYQPYSEASPSLSGVPSGWSVSVSSCIRSGGWAYLSLAPVPTTAWQPSSSGNVTDITICTISSGFRPRVHAHGTSMNVVVSSTVRTNGNVDLTAAAGGIGAGQTTAILQFAYPLA